MPGSPWRRGLAWGVDFGLIVVVAVGLGAVTYKRILSPFGGVKAEVADGFVKLFTSGFDFETVAADTGGAVWREVSGLVIQGFVALVVVEFLYQFIALAWTGRTVGKALCDLRVADQGADVGVLGKGRAAARAAVTAITNTGLYSLACCVLLSGQVVLSVLCWMAAVAAFWANALPVLGRRRLSLADLAAGTAVSGGGMYRAVARGVAQGGQAAADRGRQAWKRLRRTDDPPPPPSW